MKTFKLGQKVIVNTGGNDSVAIIDYPTIEKDIYGKKRDYKFTVNNETNYMCRFTDDIKRCICGGAKNVKESFKAEDHTLFTNGQFIPEQYIRAEQ